MTRSRPFVRPRPTLDHLGSALRALDEQKWLAFTLHNAETDPAEGLRVVASTLDVDTSDAVRLVQGAEAELVAALGRDFDRARLRLAHDQWCRSL